MSIQPRKQRKRIYTMPLHARRRLLSANLSKELREKHKRRNVRVRKGDKVKIMRGQFKGIVGVVNKVDLKKVRVYVEGAKMKKQDGTEILYPIHPSNVQIIDLKNDNMRFKGITWQEEAEDKGN